MQTVLITLHVLFAIAIVALVLIQRGEGGGLGFGGGGMQGFMSARGKASLMTRLTALTAALFFVSSLGLSILVARTSDPASIVEDISTDIIVEEEPVSSEPTVPVSE